ncbi:E3 ubiquitin-protein ligase MYCBP2-like [Copidosoma floridanum]|uniref:E3 ubiquitin-protein ligase MYCBP2-like n=1 Tax=Copidosoma floridanum TaxID=29053 RepID=UPI000C6F595B|nr:E3 ubiquitin-protein ligase MYCBP2-like [Copidosoma floridanum]
MVPIVLTMLSELERVRIMFLVISLIRKQNKCRYCCSVAIFFCFGTTHFCKPCHDDFQRVTHIPKNELPSCPAGPRAKQLGGEECPLYVKHPPTGEEFALGCGICRNAQTF